jgi:hypothetical protein
MPLRDFEHIRERRAVYIETRHVVRGLLAVAVIAGLCFGLGYRFGVGRSESVATPQPPVPPPPWPAVVELPAPSSIATLEPIVPRPLQPVPAPVEAEPDRVTSVLAQVEAQPPPQPTPTELEARPQPTPEAVAVAEAEAPAANDAPAEAELPAAEAAPDTPAPREPEPAPPPEPTAVAVVSPNQAAPATEAIGPLPLPVWRPRGRPWPRLGALRLPLAPAVANAKEPGVRSRSLKPVTGPKGEQGFWWVQVRAFRTDQDAKDFLDECATRGYSGTISRTDTQDKGTFWRVRIGPYLSLERGKTAQRQFDGGKLTDSVVLFVGVN